MPLFLQGNSSVYDEGRPGETGPKMAAVQDEVNP
jgi:hypothetical protein